MTEKATPNESFWLKAIDLHDRMPPLEEETEADIALVGGGYTCLVAAYLLKKRNPDLEVIVLEGNYVGFGSSGRNAGMVLCEPHLERVRASGEHAVRFTFEEGIRTMDFIEKLGREVGLDCELERTGYFDIAFNEAHRERHRRWCEQSRRLGIELELYDRERIQEAIGSERFRGAILYPRAAMLHPGRYIAGLKRAVLKLGVRLYEGTGVKAVTDQGSMVLLSTERGRVRAKNALVGLNAYLPAAGLSLLRDRAVTLFSFITLTEPLGKDVWKSIRWQGRQGYSDQRRIHNYVRLTGQRILFGGRVRYHFGLTTPEAIERLYAELHRELLATFPSLKRVAITHRWCGPIALTRRRTPIIGRKGRIYYALGYSGMGVTLGTLSGRALADIIVGNEDPWRDLLYWKDRMAPLPPEPFRYLGFQASYLAMKLGDWLDDRRR